MASLEQNYYGQGNSLSHTRGIFHFLFNPKVHYRVKNCPLLDPVYSPMKQLISFHEMFPRSVIIILSHIRRCLPIGFFSACLRTKLGTSVFKYHTNKCTCIFFYVYLTVHHCDS